MGCVKYEDMSKNSHDLVITVGLSSFISLVSVLLLFLHSDSGLHEVYVVIDINICSVDEISSLVKLL